MVDRRIREICGRMSINAYSKSDWEEVVGLLEESFSFAFGVISVVAAFFVWVLSGARNFRQFHSPQNGPYLIFFYGALCFAIWILTPFILTTQEERREEARRIERLEKEEELHQRRRSYELIRKQCEKYPLSSDCQSRLTKEEAEAVFELNRQNDCINMGYSRFGRCN